jgi:hypothetical protein
MGAAALAAGCSDSGTTEPPVDDGIIVDVPPPPSGAKRLVTPTFQVEGGTEVVMCMRVPFEVTEDLYVNSTVAYQATGGHHSMLYYTPPGQPPLNDEPHECEGSDMSGLRFIGVGTAYGLGIALPKGMALKIPAGGKIYTQSHYLNTGSEPRMGQDVLDLMTIPAAEVEQIAGTYAEVDLSLELPANAETTRTIDCNVPIEMTVPWMFPHMHEWGFHAKLEVVVGGVTKTVFDSDWDEALRDHFPVIEFEPHLKLTPADRIITTCTWRNTSSTPLLFPREMCATFMPFYPSATGALLACDETGKNFEP